ncbi:MAG: glucose/arabinose dehydrogenase, partial [Patiriisocius sp.]
MIGLLLSSLRLCRQLMRHRHHHSLVVGLAMLFGGYGHSANIYEPLEPEQYSITVVADSLNHPWSLAFLPDGRMLVTERSGQLRIIDEGKVSTPLAGVPDVFAKSQGG